MKQVRVTEPLLADEVIEPGLNPAILPLSLLVVLRVLKGEFTSFSGMCRSYSELIAPDSPAAPGSGMAKVRG